MADDVQVKFGADIADAIAAIAQLKDAITSITAPVAQVKAAYAQIGDAQTEAAATAYQEAMSNAAALQQIDAANLAAFKNNMRSLVDEKQITTQQALGFDLAYSAQLNDGERRRLQSIIDADTTTVDERRRTTDQLVQLDAQYAAEAAEAQRRIADQAELQAQRVQRAYEQAFDRLGSSLQHSFNDILTGQLTWQKGAVKLVQDFETFFLDQIETMTAKWAASGLADLAGSAVATAVGGAQATGGTGLGAGLMALIGINQPGGLFGTGLISGTGGAAQTTAVTTAMTEMSTTTTSAMAEMVTAVDTAMAALSGTVATGEAAEAGADLAGAAAGGSAGGWGFSGLLDLVGFARGGIVPSAARGWALPSFAGAVPALLHEREMVLPADISQGLQNMIGSGGGSGAGDTHLHIHAIDSRSGAQFVMSQAHTIARALQRAQRGFNPSTMTR
ncbi:MAG: hypothetical protein JO038_01435 [Alphaproteobacteria bacterium]|nr:hypothetical protein [Alphaproteobacteria bacterium]